MAPQDGCQPRFTGVCRVRVSRAGAAIVCPTSAWALAPLIDRLRHCLRRHSRTPPGRSQEMVPAIPAHIFPCERNWSYGLAKTDRPTHLLGIYRELRRGGPQCIFGRGNFLNANAHCPAGSHRANSDVRRSHRHVFSAEHLRSSQRGSIRGGTTLRCVGGRPTANLDRALATSLPPTLSANLRKHRSANERAEKDRKGCQTFDLGRVPPGGYTQTYPQGSETLRTAVSTGLLASQCRSFIPTSRSRISRGVECPCHDFRRK